LKTVTEQIPAPVSLKPWTLAQEKFAQATGPRLGETANKELCRILRVLAWASPSRLSETTPRPKVRFLTWATTVVTRVRLPRLLT